MVFGATWGNFTVGTQATSGVHANSENISNSLQNLILPELLHAKEYAWSSSGHPTSAI